METKTDIKRRRVRRRPVAVQLQQALDDACQPHVGIVAQKLIHARIVTLSKMVQQERDDKLARVTAELNTLRTENEQLTAQHDAAKVANLKALELTRTTSVRVPLLASGKSLAESFQDQIVLRDDGWTPVPLLENLQIIIDDPKMTPEQKALARRLLDEHAAIKAAEIAKGEDPVVARMWAAYVVDAHFRGLPATDAEKRAANEQSRIG